MAYADSASDLAMLEAVGFPVAVNPESRLSAIARRRGWHVEHWAKAEGGSHRPLPLGPFDVRAAQGGDGPMSTLLFERSLPRFAAARVVSSFGSGRGAGVGPLRLVEQDAPQAPARRLGPRRPGPVGHLRVRPGHAGRAQLALLRGHRLLPLRAGPRGRRHAGRGRHRRRG